MSNPLEESECLIAKQLKEECDTNGREKDLEKSAKLLHKLGIVHKEKNPNDMISLIQSAALLNAAIARKPENASEIQLDLKMLCRHVLNVAEAKQKDADLLEKAANIKDAINEMRMNVNASLNKINSIPEDAIDDNQIEELERAKVEAIKKIQNEITSQFKVIMASVSKYCVKVMGESPCKFAQVGMGSLARSEITPYSDFENILVLEEGCQNDHDIYIKNVLPYFRWFAVIFQLVLINLQETIIPSVNITTLNDQSEKGRDWFFDDFTTRGISFDGMMPHACKSPLGRQQLTPLKPWKTELIKPVSEMLKYLETEEDLKNGYHLCDILTKVCFVYGEKNIFEQFSDGVAKVVISCDNEINKQQIVSQIKEDVDNFNAKLCLSANEKSKSFNFKRIVYRSTTLFISALGRLHNVMESSCFEILNRLEKKNVLSNFAKRKLEYSVALACEIRLRMYMKSSGQKDWIEKYPKGENRDHVLVEAVGESSCISYFQIAYTLQCDLCRELNIKRTHFFSYLSLMNISVCEFLGLTDKVKRLLKYSMNGLSVISQFREFDSCLKELENGMKELKEKQQLEKEMFSESRPSNGDQFLQLLNELFKAKLYNDAALIGKKKLPSWLLSIHNEEEFKDKCNALRMTAQSIKEIGNDFEALAYYEVYLRLARKLFTENEDVSDVTTIIQMNEIHFKEASQCKEVVSRLEKEISFNVSMENNEDAEKSMATTFDNIGQCLLDTSQYKEAMVYFEKSRNVKERTTLNKDTDRDLADTFNNIALCFMDTSQHKKAMAYFEKCKEIEERTSTDQDTDTSLATTYHNIGRCFWETNKYEEAMVYFEKSKNVEERMSLDKETDKSLATTYNNMGLCLKDTRRFKEAMLYFEKSQKIREHTSLDQDTDRSLAITYDNIGQCLRDTSRHEEAIVYFNRSIKIYEGSSLDQDSDRSLADTYSNIGQCFIDAGQYEVAMIYFQKSKQINERTSLDRETDRSLAVTYDNIGQCLTDTEQNVEAMVYFDKSKKIKERTSINQDADRSLATTYNNIGISLMNTNQYKEAMNYFEKSKKIKECTSVEQATDRSLAIACGNIGRCLRKTRQYKEAMVYLEKSINIYECASLDPDTDRPLADTFSDFGHCLMGTNQHEEAIVYFQKSKTINECTSHDQETDGILATTYSSIGLCLMKMGQHNNAMLYFEKCKKIEENISPNQETDSSLATTYNNIGLCLKDANQYNEALVYFEKSKKIYECTLRDQNNSRPLADTINNIGQCLMFTSHYTEAMPFFEKCKKIYECTSHEEGTAKSLIDTCNNIGLCLKRSNPNEEDKTKYNKPKKVKKCS